MKFTDGYWMLRPGVTAAYAVEAEDIVELNGGLIVTAPTSEVRLRGQVLNLPVLTVGIHAVAPGVVKVRVEHFTGAHQSPGFPTYKTRRAGAAIESDDSECSVVIDASGARLTSGSLRVEVKRGAPWEVSFWHEDRRLTGSGPRSMGHFTIGPGSTVTAEPAGVTPVTVTGLASEPTYMRQQLDLGVGELIYGLGERFGPLVKNGQSVEIWNGDGGTSSEQAYKNVPFYLSNRGYGVLVNHPEHVSFEVGSEDVERVQFSVPGEAIEYLVFDGPTPQEVIERYTMVVGRPAKLPAWSFGLWLSTSFTTQYDEATVTSFVDGMRARSIPLSVFHFDCFWMREYNWTDLRWDDRVFPDPEAMLERMHKEKDLHVCVWINPYIAQRSQLFDEGKSKGYLLKRPDGSVWQWDMWVAGMALVDFTNPEATAWFQGKIRDLVRQGVDAIKTDFGERVPTDVVWYDGTSPHVMHNLYSYLYNKAVFDALQEVKGEGQAVLFARSATTGGQQFPVHWGGDNTSSFPSMAETLRGGLSLASSGFGFWSHDIGGFEGTPDPAVFKRWLAFGLLSSHSRLHGSNSYRVPWTFDEEAVDVTRLFAQLKCSLMPYLFAVAENASENGTSMARPMFFEFPDDPAVGYLDRQFMLGPSLLVAPVMSADGSVDVYLPQGTWTHLLSGEKRVGGQWIRETYGFDSLPLFVREGAIIARGSRCDRPDYDYLDGLRLDVYSGGGAVDASVDVVTVDHKRISVRVTGSGDAVTATGPEGLTVEVRVI